MEHFLELVVCFI